MQEYKTGKNMSKTFYNINIGLKDINKNKISILYPFKNNYNANTIDDIFGISIGKLKYLLDI